MLRQQTASRFTEQEMDIAKGTDLPDLLTHLGYQVRRVGSYYTTKEMDSIRIKDRRTWRRYSNQTGGDSITFLQEFCGKDFREAVCYLLDFNGHRSRDSPVPHRPHTTKMERPAFVLPEAAICEKEGSPPRSSRDSSGQVCCMRTQGTTTVCL